MKNEQKNKKGNQVDKVKEEKKQNKQTNKSKTTVKKANSPKTGSTKNSSSTRKNESKKVMTESVKENKSKVISKSNAKNTATDVNENTKKEGRAELKKLLILIAIISAVFLIFYGITCLVNNDKMSNIFKKDDSLGSTEFDYTKILVGNALTQNPEEYYILALKSDDENISSYNNLITEYNSYQYQYKIYTIDLDDTFNKKYLAEESSFDNDKLIFKKTTLIKVNNGELGEIYEADSEINDVLDSLLENAKENTK